MRKTVSRPKEHCTCMRSDIITLLGCFRTARMSCAATEVGDAGTSDRTHQTHCSLNNSARLPRRSNEEHDRGFTCHTLPTCRYHHAQHSAHLEGFHRDKRKRRAPSGAGPKKRSRTCQKSSSGTSREFPHTRRRIHTRRQQRRARMGPVRCPLAQRAAAHALAQSHHDASTSCATVCSAFVHQVADEMVTTAFFATTARKHELAINAHHPHVKFFSGRSGHQHTPRLQFESDNEKTQEERRRPPNTMTHGMDDKVHLSLAAPSGATILVSLAHVPPDPWACKPFFRNSPCAEHGLPG